MALGTPGLEHREGYPAVPAECGQTSFQNFEDLLYGHGARMPPHAVDNPRTASQRCGCRARLRDLRCLGGAQELHERRSEPPRRVVLPRCEEARD